MTFFRNLVENKELLMNLVPMLCISSILVLQDVHFVTNLIGMVMIGSGLLLVGVCGLVGADVEEE